MRRRNGLMGFSLIRGSCLEVEVPNPSILKTEHPDCHLISVRLNPSSSTTLRAALSRESGFVPWHELPVRGAAAFPSALWSISAVATGQARRVLLTLAA